MKVSNKQENIINYKKMKQNRERDRESERK